MVCSGSAEGVGRGRVFRELHRQPPQANSGRTPWGWAIGNAAPAALCLWQRTAQTEKRSSIRISVAGPPGYLQLSRSSVYDRDSVETETVTYRSIRCGWEFYCGVVYGDAAWTRGAVTIADCSAMEIWTGDSVKSYGTPGSCACWQADTRDNVGHDDIDWEISRSDGRTRSTHLREVALESATSQVSRMVGS